MTAPQLWETTMDPARRTLLQVRLEDIAACEEIFTTLMGEDVESTAEVYRRECAGCEEPGYLGSHRTPLARTFSPHRLYRQLPGALPQARV